MASQKSFSDLSQLVAVDFVTTSIPNIKVINKDNKNIPIESSFADSILKIVSVLERSESFTHSEIVNFLDKLQEFTQLSKIAIQHSKEESIEKAFAQEVVNDATAVDEFVQQYSEETTLDNLLTEIESYLQTSQSVELSNLVAEIQYNKEEVDFDTLNNIERLSIAFNATKQKDFEAIFIRNKIQESFNQFEEKKSFYLKNVSSEELEEFQRQILDGVEFVEVDSKINSLIVSNKVKQNLINTVNELKQSELNLIIKDFTDVNETTVLNWLMFYFSFKKLDSSIQENKLYMSGISKGVYSLQEVLYLLKPVKEEIKEVSNSSTSTFSKDSDYVMLVSKETILSWEETKTFPETIQNKSNFLVKIATSKRTSKNIFTENCKFHTHVGIVCNSITAESIKDVSITFLSVEKSKNVDYRQVSIDLSKKSSNSYVIGIFDLKNR
jgi:hypothetical protein